MNNKKRDARESEKDIDEVGCVFVGAVCWFVIDGLAERVGLDLRFPAQK